MKYPCGCEDEVINKTYYIKPCSLNCEIYKYVIEQSKKQGNRIEYQPIL